MWSGCPVYGGMKAKCFRGSLVVRDKVLLERNPHPGPADSRITRSGRPGPPILCLRKSTYSERTVRRGYQAPSRPSTRLPAGVH